MQTTTMKIKTIIVSAALTALLAALAPAMRASLFSKKPADPNAPAKSAKKEYAEPQKMKPTGNPSLDAIQDKIYNADVSLSDSRKLIIQAIQNKTDSKTQVASAVDAGGKAEDRTAEAQQSYSDMLKNATDLTAEGKVIFSQGVDKYADGVAGVFSQLSAVNDFINQTNITMKTASGMDSLKLLKAEGQAAAIAGKISVRIGPTMTIAGRIIQYGVKNGVNVSNLQKVVTNYQKEANTATAKTN